MTLVHQISHLIDPHAKTFVIEAAARSGALITSRCALEQGREVFAVPGKIGQPQAVGTNRLIQQGAKLVSCIEDVLEEFPDIGILRREVVDARDKASCFLSDGEKKILNVLSDEPVYMDDVLTRSGLDYQDVMRILLKFECDGRIRRLPGSYFMLNNLRI